MPRFVRNKLNVRLELWPAVDRVFRSVSLLCHRLVKLQHYSISDIRIRQKSYRIICQSVNEPSAPLVVWTAQTACVRALTGPIIRTTLPARRLLPTVTSFAFQFATPAMLSVFKCAVGSMAIKCAIALVR